VVEHLLSKHKVLDSNFKHHKKNWTVMIFACLQVKWEILKRMSGLKHTSGEGKNNEARFQRLLLMANP
jgi:hypothetical protein